MEKKLLLLGALRGHEMHGYRLNEMLAQSAGLPLTLTKPNAYKLLGKMEQDGWISYREEQEGNRPPRRVYSITDTGEAAFQQMLRDNLAAYSAPEFPAAVGLNFLELLPAEEAAQLLQERRQQVTVRYDELQAVPVEMREQHPGMVYLYLFYEFELAWLDKLLTKLGKSQFINYESD